MTTLVLVLTALGSTLMLLSWGVVAARTDELARRVAGVYGQAIDRVTAQLVEQTGRAITLDVHDTMHITGSVSITLQPGTVRAAGTVHPPALTPEQQLAQLRDELDATRRQLGEVRRVATEAHDGAIAEVEQRLATELAPARHERWAQWAHGLGLVLLVTAALLAVAAA